MDKILRSVSLAALVVAVGGVLAADITHPVTEQMFFAEDQDIQHPVPRSPAVLKVLLETKEAKTGFQYASPSERDHLEQLFRAAEVHLTDSDEANLVVIGMGVMPGETIPGFGLCALCARIQRSSAGRAVTPSG